ncbi:hypothetical protein N1851_006668 [Merluccius polli]|uniref:Uncharacterized protein n=1 Tax=Merluccius polli TaxID=89951 RepID=A0AA47N505_MERPO|nr:hypothetical protein N1851_006668 [Merluccius polli]
MAAHSFSEIISQSTEEEDHKSVMDFDEMDEPVLVTANGRKKTLSSPQFFSLDSCIRPWIKLRKTRTRHHARPQVEDVQKRRQRDVSIKYAVLKEDKIKVPICQASFLSIFCKRIEYRILPSTGLNRAKHAQRIVVVPGKMRSYWKRSKRLKTTSNHSVAGLVTMPDVVHLGGSSPDVLGIFIYDFNLAFGHPAKDICLTCVKHKIAINNPDSSAEEKRDKMIFYTLHRRGACQFYDSLNDVADSFTVCFHIMENLVLPKSAIGQAYYSRQLYLYVFGVVCHRGRGEPQSRQDINLYTWMEFENSKDSNIVASALQHFFPIVAQADLCHFQSLRLFSDSCYGQNKNINVLSMLFALRSQLYPQLDITYFFPVRGHSFLNTILLPEEYVSILWKHGTVHQYRKDWECYNFKREAATFTASQRSFKISEARVLNICGDKLGFKPVFAVPSLATWQLHKLSQQDRKQKLLVHDSLNCASVLRFSFICHWSHFKPAPLPDVNCIKEAKKTDVLKLLDELGAEVALDFFVVCHFD